MIDATVAPKVGFISPFGTTVCNVNHSNATLHLPPEAGARYERTLEAVGCRRLFGDATVPESPESLTAHSSGFFALGQVHCMPTYLRACIAARLYSYGDMP